LAVRAVKILRWRGAVDEGGGGEGGEQRKSERDILDSMAARSRGDEKQRTDPPGADELRRHHAIGVAWSTQNPHEPNGDRQKDHASRGEKKISQCRPPA
jgi:hypothetical protein